MMVYIKKTYEHIDFELTVADSHLALTETLAFLFGGEIAWVVIPGNSCVRCSLFCTDTKLANCRSFLSSLLFPTSLSF